MNQHFGPWTTAIHEHGTVRLTAFWKRRFNALPALSARGHVSRVSTAGVFAVALLGFGLPTCLVAPANAENDSAPAEGQADAVQPDAAHRPDDSTSQGAASHQSGDKVAAQAEQPALRFLGREHQRPENQDEPLRGTYWLPSGKRVTSQTELAPLRRVFGKREERPREGSRFVHVFISHPEFRGPSTFGQLDLLNADGSTIDDALLRRHPFSNNFALGPKAPEHLRRPGWQYYYVRFSPHVGMPEKATIWLHYTAGEGRRVALIPVDAPADREVSPGVRLREIGEDDNGHASIAVAIDGERDRDFHYHFSARDHNGRPVPGHGRLYEPAGRFTCTFRARLKDVARFDLIQWEKRFVEFKDVALWPLD